MTTPASKTAREIARAIVYDPMCGHVEDQRWMIEHIEAALAAARAAGMAEGLEAAANIADEVGKKAGDAYEFAYDMEAARLYGVGHGAETIADRIRAAKEVKP